MSMENMDVTSSEMLKVLNVRKEVKEKLASYRYAVNQPKVNMETVVAEYDKMASVYDEVSERLFFFLFFLEWSLTEFLLGVSLHYLVHSKQSSFDMC